MNKAILIGNLARDPELRKTQSGLSVCTFTVACNRRKAKDGTQQADFLPVVVWRELADNCYKYLAKGRKVSVVGMIVPRSYDDKNGGKRWTTEIIADEVEFLTAKGETEHHEEPFVGMTQTDIPDDLPF